MWVRGAPLIGAVAAYGLALQARADAGDAALQRPRARLQSARPTAVNLAWALQRMLRRAAGAAAGRTSPPPPGPRPARSPRRTCRSTPPSAATACRCCRRSSARRAGPVNVLTHCNAGWLATVDWGTATSPIYQAHAAGLPVHVWVDETRPRNQGASLTAWELASGRRAAHGDRRQRRRPPHAARPGRPGHRRLRPRHAHAATSATRSAPTSRRWRRTTTACRSIVAMPTSTLDLSMADGLREIPIEERERPRGHPRQRPRRRRAGGGGAAHARPASAAANPAFDVTPARLVSGLVTEHGVVAAEEARCCAA